MKEWLTILIATANLTVSIIFNILALKNKDK